jgi:hypothetical protein
MDEREWLIEQIDKSRPDVKQYAKSASWDGTVKVPNDVLTRIRSALSGGPSVAGPGSIPAFALGLKAYLRVTGHGARRTATDFAALDAEIDAFAAEFQAGKR